MTTLIAAAFRSDWRRCAAVAVVLALFAVAPSAHANTCRPATSAGTAAADWQSFCWLDFTGYNDATARSAGGQGFSFTLSDGSTLNLTVNAVSTAATALAADAAPSWSGAAVGNTAFIGIPGAPILYTLNNASTVTVTLSNIRITPPAGVVATSSYAFVAADAESTNQGESLSFTTNGGNWTVLEQVPPISGSNYPALTNSGSTVSEAGAAGTVGGYIFGTTNSPTTISARLVAGGLQGVMFAVRYAWVSVNEAIVSTRIAAADQFKYAVTATSGGTQLVSGTTTGAGAGPFSAALVTVSSGYPVSLSESMAPGSTSPIGNYVPRLTCTNATPGSPTVLPVAVATTSFSLGTLAYGDAVTCVFTNTALPRLTLSKALAGSRVFAADQFTLNLASGGTILATTTTTGTGVTLGNAATPTAVTPAAQPYTFTEGPSGSTSLSYYTAAMSCTNAFAGSPTVLPAAPGGSVTPRAGDNIVCTITNTPKPSTVTLSVQKTSAVVSDPVNGTSNPKGIPGSTIRYLVTVKNNGTAAVDANALAITDVVPANTSLYVATTAGNPVTFADGTPASGLGFNYGTAVTFSNQIGGGAPYNYIPHPNAAGVDPAVTGLRIAPSGTLPGATAAGQPGFSLSFTVVVR